MGEMGWFSGRAVDLHPLSDVEHARLLLELAGNPDTLYLMGTRHLREDRFQSALEIAEALSVLGYSHQELKARALKGLAESQFNANARNYYLTQLQELEGQVELIPEAHDQENTLRTCRCSDVFRALGYHYNPSADPFHLFAESILFIFQDIHSWVSLRFRHGVMHVEITDSREEMSDHDYHVDIAYSEFLNVIQHPFQILRATIQIRDHSCNTLGLVTTIKWFHAFSGLFDTPKMKG